MQVVVKYSEFDNDLGQNVNRQFRVELRQSTKNGFATAKFGSADERRQRAEEDVARSAEIILISELTPILSLLVSPLSSSR